MIRKHQFNLKKYQSPKKGKGFMIKITLYIILLIVIFIFLQRRLKESKLDPTENIDTVHMNHLNIDTTGY